MGTRIRRSVATLAKRAAVAHDQVRPPPDGLTILGYHRIGGQSDLELDIEAGEFDRQMACLADRGDVVSLDDLLTDDGGVDLPAPGRVTTAVTFDDGTADFIEHALASLVRHGVPATYYIATDFIERGRPFPYDGHPLTWSALAEAISTGLVTVGSHTHSHAVLAQLDTREAEDELKRAGDLIGERLGVVADHFAYPKGVFGGDPIEEVVARHHRTAALADSRVNTPDGVQPLRLGRTPVQRGDDLRTFERKARGGLRLEGSLREALNRVRYRHSTN